MGSIGANNTINQWVSVVRPDLSLLLREYGERNKAIIAAHRTGEYSYQQIGDFFGLHFTSVGKIVRAAKKSKHGP